MEHSPSLRVRAFNHQPVPQQRHNSALAMPTQPSNMFMRRQQPSAQTHAARRPLLDPNPVVQQPVMAAHGHAGNGHEAEQWPAEEMPDTPEAPRAATAAQNQAAADALFDAAVSEGEGGMQAEPSWLGDAAAYDAAAAEIDTNGLEALEILSDDDDAASVHGLRSTAAPGFALTSLDQLVLSSDSEDDSAVADSVAETLQVPSSTDTPQHARLRLLQQVFRSGTATQRQAQAAASSVLAAPAASESSDLPADRAEQLVSAVIDLRDSPAPAASRQHDRQHTVISDVTSRYLPEEQQQQEDQPANAAEVNKPVTSQRRRRLACRQHAQGTHINANQLGSSSIVSSTAPAALVESTAAGLQFQQEQHSAVAAQLAGQGTDEAAASPVAIARCTRSHARRNQQPSISHQMPTNAESTDAMQTQSAEHAVLSHARAIDAAISHSQADSGSRQGTQTQQIGNGRPQRTVKNRPRLQLNRATLHE